MLKFIDKKRRIIAVLLALAAGAAALPFMLSGNADTAVISAVSFAAVFVIAAALFIKGVPAAAIVFIYALMICAAVIVSLTLNYFTNINESFISSAMIAVIVFLTITLKLPAKIKNRLKNYLNPGEAQEVIEYTPAQFTYSYKTYLAQRKRNRYLAKPYALENLPQKMKIIRLIIGLIFMAAGGIVIIIFVEAEDGAESFLNSYVFWVLMAGFASFLFGTLSLGFGFIRSLFTVVFSAGITVLAVWAGYQLYYILQQSVFRFIILLILILSLVVYISRAVIKYYKRKSVFFCFTNYDKGEENITVDLALKDLLPVEGYTKLIRGELTVSPQTGLDSIGEICAEIVACADKNKMIFCGYTTESPEIETIVFTFYLYADRDRSAEVKKLLKKIKNGGVMAACREDAEWSAYTERLYPPDSYTLFTIGNRNLNYFLEKSGYDFNKPVSLIYTLTFSSGQDALGCAEAAKAAGYVRARHEDNTENVAEYELSEKLSHFVYIQNDCMAGLEQLNAQTRKIMGFAEKFNGEFCDFDLGELARQEE